MISLVNAIARQEGFLINGSRAQRNNNPGNINWGSFAKAHGATSGDDQNYAIFPSPEMGFGALRILLSTRYAGKTLREAIGEYCPEDDERGPNDPSAYVQALTKMTGIGPDEIIDSYL